MARRGTGVRPRGFTLVEIMVTLCILVVFVGIVWAVATSWMRSSAIGIWREQVSQELQRASTQMRKYVTEASYPSASTPEVAAMAAHEEHFLVLNPEGKGQAYGSREAWDEEEWDKHKDCVRYVFGPGGASDTSEKVILSLVKGVPGYAGLPNMPNSPARAVRIRLVLKDGKAIRGRGELPFAASQTLYAELTDATPVDPESFDEKTTFAFGGEGRFVKLLDDVARVVVWADHLPQGKTDAKTEVPVGIKVLCVEPSMGRAKIVGKVVAKPQTGVIAR